MRTLFRILTGLVAAMIAAALTMVLFALPPTEFAGMDAAARGDRLFEMGALMLRAATHALIFCAGFAPIVVLIAEWQKLRDWSYYVVVGIVIAAGGFLAQFVSEAAAQPTILNNYALVAFVTTGAVGGLVYWMIAGRHAGARSAVETGVHSSSAAPVTSKTKPAAGKPVPPPAQAGERPAKDRGLGAKNTVETSVRADTTTGAPSGADDARTGDPTRTATSVPSAGTADTGKRQFKGSGTVPDSGAKREKS